VKLFTDFHVKLLLISSMFPYKYEIYMYLIQNDLSKAQNIPPLDL